ncbi:four helix bundle protein [Capnocytophaga gingivalis]|uniref:four helix bundle protein n=1 Tax=Capnocytophaga gingivalis TaxID=1017 RepID=UPI0023F14A03
MEEKELQEDKKGILSKKTYNFAIRIVKLSKFLRESNEYVLSKQLLRSGTAIGALIREAEYAQSISDFVSKLSIALKEANETLYWISLLYDTEHFDEKIKNSFQKDCDEIISILVTSIKTGKKRINQKGAKSEE